jgi:DNA-binding transcriptional LysR family regulator
MGRLDDLLASGAGFEPKTSTRTFVVATSDYTASVLMGPLLECLHSEAPGVTVRVVQTVPDAEQALTDGAWDVLWAPHRALSQAIVWTRLFDEQFAFVLRAGHPLAHRPLTLERYLSIPQVALSPEGKPGNPLDAQLERLGHRRRIVAHVPTFATVPPLVATSDLGAVLPRRIIAQHAAAWRLVSRPLPFEVRSFTLEQAWHVRHRHDAGHGWFRKRVAGLVRG